MDDLWTMEKLIFGIRHNKTFSVADIFGEIADRLIPLQGSGSFPVDCFAKIVRVKDSLSYILRDEENTLSVHFGVEGIVLECDMQAEPPIDSKTVFEMFHEITNTVIPLSEGKNKINRLGVIHKYSLSSFSNAAQELFSTILNIDIKGTPDDINIRCALKNPTSEAIFDPTKKVDYNNVILQLSSTREDEETPSLPDRITVAVDYQIYYNPVRPFKDVDITTHFSEAQDYITNTIKKSNLAFDKILQK
jgi:hypothetical protein